MQEVMRYFVNRFIVDLQRNAVFPYENRRTESTIQTSLKQVPFACEEEMWHTEKKKKCSCTTHTVRWKTKDKEDKKSTVCSMKESTIITDFPSSET